ncbi:MAG: GLPGLI family protein [Saprospiraceae bacterium]|nr:GLPGLI family protein [Saprospiraceae bacterium]
MAPSIKYWLFSFLLFASSTASRAQETPQPPEGKILYVATYNWTKMMESIDYISKQRKERNAYMWGGTRSEYKQHFELYLNPTQSFYKEADHQPGEEEYGWSWRKSKFALRRDFSTGLMNDIYEMEGKVYLVEDSIQAPDWKIMNDIKEVAGHICMNAYLEDTLKNQKITVWFALDIPHSGGPEYFCGLPGLILEVDINDGALLMVADKIELRPVAEEMKPKKVKGKKINSDAYQKMIEKQIKEARKNEMPWIWNMRYL